MGIRDWFRNTASKQEEEQQKEQALHGKAGEKQQGVDTTAKLLSAEEEKQRRAEARGDTTEAERAKEEKERLDQQKTDLKSEVTALEAAAQRQHEKAERDGAKLQSASQLLEQATAHVPKAERVPIEGSVSEMKQKELQELASQPVQQLSERAMAEARAVASSRLLYQTTEQRISYDATSDSSDDSSGGNAPIAQRSLGKNKNVVQEAAGSPTTAGKEATVLENKGAQPAKERDAPEKQAEKESEEKVQRGAAKRRSGWER